MREPITIFDPRVEAAVHELGWAWWGVGAAAAIAAGVVLVGFLLLRRRARLSVGERAAQSLARAMRLDRPTRRALRRVAEELEMKDQAGVLLLSRSALLDAVARLAVKKTEKATIEAARLLVDRVVGPTGR